MQRFETESNMSDKVYEEGTNSGGRIKKDKLLSRSKQAVYDGCDLPPELTTNCNQLLHQDAHEPSFDTDEFKEEMPVQNLGMI